MKATQPTINGGQPARSMKGHYEFSDGIVNKSGFLMNFSVGELHINRISALGLGRNGINSWISKGLHVVADGEVHGFWGNFTAPFEFIRNRYVDVAELGYYARSHYVY